MAAELARSCDQLFRNNGVKFREFRVELQPRPNERADQVVIPESKSNLKRDIVALYCDGVISVGLCERLIKHFRLWGA